MTDKITKTDDECTAIVPDDSSISSILGGQI